MKKKDAICHSFALFTNFKVYNVQILFTTEPTLYIRMMIVHRMLIKLSFYYTFYYTLRRIKIYVLSLLLLLLK